LSESKKDRLPPNQRWINRIPRWNVDHPGIVPENPKIDLDLWRLSIDGEIEKAKTLNWNELLALPACESLSDFHCVEGWSVPDCKWFGVRFRDLVELVKPKPEAKYVFFSCMDGYTTSLNLEDLADDEVVLAYKLNGEYLEGTTGAPVRLVVPRKYAYKSAMSLERITFMKTDRLGYWEEKGYSNTADAWRNDRRAKQEFTY